MRRALVTTLLAIGLAAPSPASGRPCSDSTPVFADGIQWIVYTGDSAAERRAIPCSKARRIAKRMLRTRTGTSGWRCSARLHRCVRGGTYEDAYGNRQWRYLVGWHLAE